MKIAVDVMGTDYGPQELVLGAVQAVRAYGCEVVLVGDSAVIKDLLAEYKAANEPRLTVHHSSQVINMDEHPGIAVKTKKMLLSSLRPSCCVIKNVMLWYPPAAQVRQ